MGMICDDVLGGRGEAKRCVASCESAATAKDYQRCLTDCAAFTPADQATLGSCDDFKNKQLREYAQYIYGHRASAISIINTLFVDPVNRDVKPIYSSDSDASRAVARRLIGDYYKDSYAALMAARDRLSLENNPCRADAARQYDNATHWLLDKKQQIPMSLSTRTAEVMGEMIGNLFVPSFIGVGAGGGALAGKVSGAGAVVGGIYAAGFMTLFGVVFSGLIAIGNDSVVGGLQDIAQFSQ